MILALLLLLFSGSDDSALVGIFDHVASSIESTVPDKHARNTLLEITGSAKEITAKHEHNRQKIYGHIVKLGDDREASADQYKALFESLSAAEESFQREMIGKRTALRDQLSREAWNQLFPPSNPSGETP